MNTTSPVEVAEEAAPARFRLVDLVRLDVAGSSPAAARPTACRPMTQPTVIATMNPSARRPSTMIHSVSRPL